MMPLNSVLYERLSEEFRRVDVTNEGMPARVTYWPDHVYRQGRLKAQVSDWGETYHVNCPFCIDTRRRLYLSHLWGVRDQRTRDDMLHLAFCQNDGCLSTRERQKELHAMVFPAGRYAGLVLWVVSSVTYSGFAVRRRPSWSAACRGPAWPECAPGLSA